MAIDFAQATKSRPITVYVSIDSIVVPAQTLRDVDMESEAFKEIYNSLIEKGQETAITVRSVGGVHPVAFRPDSGALANEVATLSPTGLVDGGHRYAALKKVAQDVAEGKLDPETVALPDYKMIRAEYIGDVSEVDMLVMQVSKNLIKADTRPIEVSRQLQRLSALEPTITQKELAARLCMHPSRLAKLLKMNTLPQEVQDKIESGEIKAANALRMTELKPATALELMDELAGASVEEANQLINTARKVDRAKAEAGGKEVFVPPAPHVRKKDEILARIQDPGDLAEATVVEVLEWVVGLDAESVAEHRVKWEAAVKKRIENGLTANLRRSAVSVGCLTDEQVKGKTFGQLTELLNAANSKLSTEMAASAQRSLIETVAKTLAEANEPVATAK